MTGFIAEALADRTLGLSLHYPSLHAAVVGLHAQRTLEFGAGGSTRVFLEALPWGGMHASISMETAEDLRARIGTIASGAGWIHACGKSEDHRHDLGGPLDLILHDGSHAADVVAADIKWVWPYLKTFGLRPAVAKASSPHQTELVEFWP